MTYHSKLLILHYSVTKCFLYFATFTWLVPDKNYKKKKKKSYIYFYKTALKKTLVISNKICSASLLLDSTANRGKQAKLRKMK